MATWTDNTNTYVKYHWQPERAISHILYFSSSLSDALPPNQKWPRY